MNDQFLQGVIFDWDRIDNDSYLKGIEAFKGIEKLDFNKTVKEVYNQIRGMYPFPVSYAVLNGQIIKVCESKIGTSTHKKPGEIINIYKDGIGVSCSDGEIIITKLKPSGKKEMLVSDYLNGKKKEDLLGKVFE